MRAQLAKLPQSKTSRWLAICNSSKRKLDFAYNYFGPSCRCSHCSNTMATRLFIYTRGSVLLRLAWYSLLLAIEFQRAAAITEYVYNYRTSVQSGTSGFRFTSQVHLQSVFAASQPDGTHLIRLKLTRPTFSAGPTSDKDTHVINSRYLQDDEHDLFALVTRSSNGTVYIEEVYSHQENPTTFKNIKKSTLQNLLPTIHHLSQHAKNLDIAEPPVCIDDNTHAQPEFFSPDSISRVKIVAIARDPSKSSVEPPFTIFQSVIGQQNLTLRSRFFAQAESDLVNEFTLDLVDEFQSASHEQFVGLKSLTEALDLIKAKGYKADSIDLQQERHGCLTHPVCDRNLAELVETHKPSLADKARATVGASLAYLRLMFRLRERQGSSSGEILDVLKSFKNNRGARNSFLDVLASARSKDSIGAALKYLKLPKSKDVDAAERFLVAISVSAKTKSKMNSGRSIISPYYFTSSPSLTRSGEVESQASDLASLEFIASKLSQILEQTPAKKWSSSKIRRSTILTLATVMNARLRESKLDQFNDELEQRVSSFLRSEMDACSSDDTDCRLVVLQAIGNMGQLGDSQSQLLREMSLGAGRRESIMAMRVLRDLLQTRAKDKPLSESNRSQLHTMLSKVVYSDRYETTSRTLAAEMILRFTQDRQAAEQLLNYLPSLGNNELATVIFTQFETYRPDLVSNQHRNWFWKSSIVNGSSASFVQSIAETESLNASYGVNVELLDKVKILKESSFEVFLDTNERTQDIFSLGIFARGLSSFTGGDEDDNENAVAGMTLRLLGGYLRPYIFFSGMGELMSHVWAGTASEPTTVLKGDLLLIDHQESYPLIGGFVVEQQMHGVLSLDVTGQVEISIWHRSSQSLVRTKASVVVETSQSVFTSDPDFWHSNQVSFGGGALIDFMADSDFSSAPFRICLQVTQPEFEVR